MRNRKLFTPGAPQRLAGINDFAAYTGLGRASAAKFGREADAGLRLAAAFFMICTPLTGISTH